MHINKTTIYQTQQIRDIECSAIERFNISAELMMQRAGKAALDFLLRRWPQAQRLAFFCGAGNNGGDGYVLAYLAHERSLKVSIWQVGDHSKLKGEAKKAHDICQQAKLNILPFSSAVDLEHPDIIIDAICGIGLKDNLREDAVAAIKKMERAQVPIFAIDIPSGINGDTGEMLGAAPHATATITFIGLKFGLLTGNGVSYAGEVILNDLQLPAELFSNVEPVAEKAQSNLYAAYLKPRTRDWHKGLSGHVLVVGGDEGFSGAPRMSGEAALRVGAGLLSIATCKSHAAFMNITRPELMCHGVEAGDELKPLIEKADVIVLGPGLAQREWSKQLWDVVTELDMPLVIDADGLNLLAKHAKSNANWVLTPHPGEAARLLNVTTHDIQKDRLAASREISRRYGGVCVLKGAGTVIVAPNSLPALCDKGNPGMASAGMGDVLSGVIAGLMAQGIPASDAAKLGVCMHAMAGDLAAREGERGLLAMDLMPYLRRLSNLSQ